jgi:hypothetical protein
MVRPVIERMIRAKHQILEGWLCKAHTIQQSPRVLSLAVFQGRARNSDTARVSRLQIERVHDGPDCVVTIHPLSADLAILRQFSFHPLANSLRAHHFLWA